MEEEKKRRRRKGQERRRRRRVGRGKEDGEWKRGRREWRGDEYSTVGEDNLDSIAGAMQWKSDLATKATYLLFSLQSVGKD